MNVFEFLVVVLAIVLGLGITELLGGVTRILRGDLASSGLHLLWVVIIFQLQVQLAWGIWGLRTREAWRYPEFLLLLLGPVLLYMAAAVLFPSAGSERADLHLLRRRRSFFLLNVGYVAVTALYSWLLFDQGWPLLPTLIRGVLVIMLGTLAVTERRAVHWILGLFMLGGHLLWTYQYTFVMSATPVGP
jgi:hypothetical protein